MSLGEELSTYDAVVIGENHTILDHADIEAAVVSRVEPEYVVYEDAPPDYDVQEEIDRYNRYPTVADAQAAVAEHDTTLFPGDAPSFMEQADLDSESALAQTGTASGGRYGAAADGGYHESLMTVPVYELPQGMLDGVVDAVEVQQERHATDNPVQEVYDEITTLYDHVSTACKRGMENKYRFFDHIHRLQGDGVVDEVVSDENLFYERQQHVAYKNPQIAALVNECDLDIREIKEYNREVDRGRETRIGRSIANRVAESKSPVVAIIGKGHAREPTQIYPVLDQHDVDYTTVWLHDEPTGDENRYIANDTELAQNILPGDYRTEPQEGAFWHT